MAKIDENVKEIAQTVAVPGTMENVVELQGLITSVLSSRKGAIVNLSCGYRGMKRDENGKFNRNRLQVVFLNRDDIKEGDYYAKNFFHGDKVIIHAIAQTVYDHVNHLKHTELWGLAMEKTDDKQITGFDKNEVHLTGKVYSLTKRDGGWYNVSVTVAVIKSHINQTNKGYRIEKRYQSILPVSLYLSEYNQNRINIEDMLTKGTWVDINGYVREYTAKSGESLLGIVGQDIQIVGDSQPRIKSDIEKEEEAVVINPARLTSGRGLTGD